MKTRVQRWGNSLAVRIPKAFADEVRLDCDAEVNMTVRNGVLTLTPVPRRKHTLQELVAGITDDNLHGETATGPSVGNESW